MNRKPTFLITLTRAACGLALLLAFARAGGVELRVTPGGRDGVYRENEPSEWRIEASGEGASTITEVGYVLKRGGETVADRGRLAVSSGVARLEAKATGPGWWLAEFEVKAREGPAVKSLGGALVAPEAIQPSRPRPSDFDAFWRAKLAELEAVPMDAVLAPAESGDPEIDYWKVTLGNIRGTRVHAQLARPKHGSKLPAQLILQWAGLYPLERKTVIEAAKAGWLVLNVIAHDLAIDEPKAYYDQLAEGRLKNYALIGDEDRETSYLLRMFLACVRSAGFLASRPDWDGRTLVATGASQGGLQTLVVAALSPKITAAIAEVPAGCDYSAPLVGKPAPWPYWLSPWGLAGRDRAKVETTCGYFDAVNFASLIRCPALVALGLIDVSCPPDGIYAACNRFAGPVEIMVMPLAGHDGSHGQHEAYGKRKEAWLRALRDGQPPPAR